ncbi:hypothetical protein Hypma_006918 [Hypsizygus marmoreus]|uniref:Uncharacterized protein n=1 Tax=Hypsizygus marmoreus TaxID=39966 RepID=A0A369JW73_HYPMA|nr:hypothetical protein Hypma_006918 [Hypsizygus marmoreus]
MSHITIQDIEDSLDETIQRWGYEITEAAKRWRALGRDRVIKDFLRQIALNSLRRQWNDGILEPEYLRVDAVCALMEAMLSPSTMKRTSRSLRCRALMRRTVEVCSGANSCKVSV